MNDARPLTPVGIGVLAPLVIRLSALGRRYLLPLVILTLPLEFTKQYFPIREIEFSRIVMVVCILLFAAELLAGRRFRLPPTLSLVGLVLFGVMAAGSAAIVGSGTGLKAALAMAIYFCVMVVAYNWLAEEADHRRIWLSLTISMLAIALIALALHVTHTYIWNPDQDSGYHRVSATFADPNILARFFAFSAAAAALFFSYTWSRRITWTSAVLAGGSGLSAAALPFTYSRAGWVVYFVILALAVAAAPKRLRALTLGIALGLVFASVQLIDPSVLKRSALLAANLGSTTAIQPHPAVESSLRTYSWLRFIPLDSERHYLVVAGLSMFQDHPLLGVGFGNFQHQIQTAYSAYIATDYTTTLSHTTVVTVLAEMGIVGFALLTFTGIALARESWLAVRRGTADAIYIACPLLCLFCIFADSQVTGRLWDEPYLWIFLGMLYAAMQRLGRTGTQA